MAILQPKKGYRVSVDALLLTYFAGTGKPARFCVDLGAGCGAVGIGLLLAAHAETLVAVEVQERLSALAAENARLNNCEERYSVIRADIREPHHGLRHGHFDLVVSNPPFWPPDKGRPPADQERRIACQEILGTIGDWTDAAARLVHRRKGRILFIYPSRRLDDFLRAIRNSRLSCSRLRFVHPVEGRDAELFLAESTFGKGGRVRIEPPIILKRPDGRDTDIASHIIRGEFSPELNAILDRRT